MVSVQTKVDWRQFLIKHRGKSIVLPTSGAKKVFRVAEDNCPEFPLQKKEL